MNENLIVSLVKRVNWFITTTNRCNLNCKYCGNEPHPDLPVRPSWKIDELVKFISTDSSPTICFYGGEPLLHLDLIQEVMDRITAEHYTLQTNGLLLHKLQSKYLQQFSSILVSIDGDKERTDYSRGKGTFDKVVSNIQDIQSRGFQGDLIARMTAHEGTDIFEDVLFLLQDEQLNFKHVHWQLDVMFDEGINTRWKDFPAWVSHYNIGISKLVRYWLEEMTLKGEVKGIVPFIGTFRHILNDTTTDLPCEAGLRSFAIRTDGKITFCPLPPEYEFSVVGDLADSSPESVRNSLKVGNKCKECEVYGLCGGRCLFAEKTKLWGEEGFDLVCEITKHYIKELQGIKPKVLELIEQGVICYEDFNYPKYNNTTEIIP